MLMLGGVCHAPKVPCPSVASPKRVLLSSLGGLGSRRLHGLFKVVQVRIEQIYMSCSLSLVISQRCMARSEERNWG